MPAQSMTGQAIQQAMILAAGLGLRMRPLTESRPKPLVELDGLPLIDHVLIRLRVAGVQRFVVNTHHLAEMLQAHLEGQGDVSVSHEPALLETGGGVLQALDAFAGEIFLVANCDSLWSDGAVSAPRRLAAHWDPEQMDALLLLQQVAGANGYAGAGDFLLEDSDGSGDAGAIGIADTGSGVCGRLLRRGARAAAPYVFTGLQILHPRAFAGMEKGIFSLNRVYDAALSQQRLYGLVHDGGWHHVGTPTQLAKAAEMFA